MGISVMDSLQVIHDAGYIYNDLKLDNLVIGDAPELPNSAGNANLRKIRVVDYGLAKKYVDPSGVHMQEQHSATFEGNLIFSSFNGQNLRSTSRRDDLISLCYLLIYSLEGTLPWLETDPELNDLEEFHAVKEMKQNTTPETLCNASDSSRLLAFVKEIFKLQFTETPDYQKLKFLLVKQLLDLNDTPNGVFDWN